MAEAVKVWFDHEADCLEVLFETKEGHFEEPDDDAVMRKIDTDGNILGFSVLKVSALGAKSPLSVSLDRRTTEPGSLQFGDPATIVARLKDGVFTIHDQVA